MLTSVFCVDKKSFQEIVESFLACSDWPVHTNNHDICDDCRSITVSSVSSIDYLLLQQTKPIHHFVVSISLPWAFSSVLTHWKNVCCIAETGVLLWCLCSQSPHLCVWFVRGERGCKVAGFPHPIFQTRLRWVPRKNYILLLCIRNLATNVQLRYLNVVRGVQIKVAM